MELFAEFKQYMVEKCGKGGRQVDNITKSQAVGLRSLKKRVKEGELVVIPTDKSGSLAVMTALAYTNSGLKHTSKDMEVG